MRILLTNDDGIYAPGILAAYRELKKIGSVTVVAPDSERSSIGHAITLAHPIWVNKVKKKSHSSGYAISGTPADCIKFAVGVLLKKKPDIIVSGINLGPNDGCSVFYSGTVAGAREGALMGIPSIAVSLATFVNPNFSFAAKFTAKLIKKVQKKSLPKGTFLNVNVPNKKSSLIRGVKVTRQSRVPIHGTFQKRTDPHSRTYYWLLGKNLATEKDMDIDTYALEKNYVTITPMQCDLTDYSYVKEINNWDI